MNMPKPLTAKKYKKHATVLRNHARLMANQSMKDAAKEPHSKSNAADSDLINCNISCDGTWQKKRGHSSSNSCVTTLSMDTRKVLDLEIMSRFCKSCAVYHHLPENSENYIQLKAVHMNCVANFKGSAPAIEQEGEFRIFRGQKRKEICDTQVCSVMVIVKW